MIKDSYAYKVLTVKASQHKYRLLKDVERLSVCENGNYITFVYPSKLWKTKLWITSQFHSEPRRGTPRHAAKTRSPPTTKLASRGDAVQLFMKVKSSLLSLVVSLRQSWQRWTLFTFLVFSEMEAFSSGELEATANIIFVFPFAPIAKEKIAFSPSPKEGKNIEMLIMLVRKVKDVKFADVSSTVIARKIPCSFAWLKLLLVTFVRVAGSRQLYIEN